MRKNIALILAVLMTICALCLVLVACNPAKLSKITGTYQLTMYSRQAKSDSDSENLIEKRGITAYLVVRDDGIGYFVYESDDVSLTAITVSLEYTYDTDDAEKVRSIEVSDAKKFSDTYIGWSNNLKVNYQGRKESYLTCSKIAFGSISPASGSTTYTRVDKATDLSYVQKQLGKDIQPLANSDLARLHGLFEMSYEIGAENKYAYRYANIDVLANSVTVYSALKEDVVLDVDKYVVAEGKESVQTYPLSVVYEGGYQLSFAGHRFVASMNENNLQLTSEVPGGPTQYMTPVGESVKTLDWLIESTLNP